MATKRTISKFSSKVDKSMQKTDAARDIYNYEGSDATNNKKRKGLPTKQPKKRIAEAANGKPKPKLKHVEVEAEAEAEEEEEEEDHENTNEQENAEEGEAEGEAEGAEPKSKVSSAEAHQKNKQLLLERKSKRKDFELIESAKRLWEDVRRADTQPQRRTGLLEKLTELMKGRVMELIFKHDASRIVQTVLKVGTAEQRLAIANEMTGNYVRLAKSPYARNTVIKVLLYCHDLRSSVIREFYGSVISLLRHKEASLVIEEIFLEYAKEAERRSLLEEFYGPEFSVFKTTEQSQAQSLSDIIAAHPEKKPSIIKHLHTVILDMINKGTVRFNVVHYAIMDFLTYASTIEIQDFMGDIREHLPEILHTNRGCRVAMLCLAHGNAKDRKIMLKSMKDVVVKIAQEEYGHMVLLRLFDVVDDTKLVSKSILTEIVKALPELIRHKYGRKILLYLLVGRSPSYFDPATLTLLQSGDEIRAATSKKEAADRSRELLEFISPYLVDLVSKDADRLFRDKSAMHVAMETILHAHDRERAIEAVVDLAAVDEDNDEHILNDIIANRGFKRLVNEDAKASGDNARFGPMLYDRIKGRVASFAMTWASVVILALLEHPLVQAAVHSEIEPLLINNQLESSKITAVVLLAKKLREIRNEPVSDEVAQRVKSLERLSKKRGHEEEHNESVKKSKKSPAKKINTPTKTATPSKVSSPISKPTEIVDVEEEEEEQAPKTPVANKAKSTPARTPRNVITRRTPPVTRSAKKPKN